MAIVIYSGWNGDAAPYVLTFSLADEDFPGSEKRVADLLEGAVIEYRSGNSWIAMPTVVTTHPPTAVVTFPPSLAGSNTSLRITTTRGSFGPIVWFFPGG